MGFVLKLRATERQTSRQTDRQTDTQPGIQTDRDSLYFFQFYF